MPKEGESILSAACSAAPRRLSSRCHFLVTTFCSCARPLTTGIILKVSFTTRTRLVQSPPSIKVDLFEPDCNLDYVTERGGRIKAEHAIRDCIALRSEELCSAKGLMSTGLGRSWFACAPMIIVLICCPLLSFAQAQPSKDRSVEVQMRNVMYHFTDSIAVHIRRLHGKLVPKGDFPIFDDKNSFTLQIETSEIAITPDSLANTLNSYVFAKPDAPLRGISIRIENPGRLIVKGRLHGRGEIPFEMTGTLAATPDGKIRLHADGLKALHLPVKGIMDLLGLKIADVIKSGNMPGVQAEKDDLILDPAGLLPPPHISGQVTQVRLEKGNIVQVFGRSDGAMPLKVPAANYMAYRGNRLRFGKLTMSDTDMVLIDMDPKDPFDFYLDRYKEQLAAGYTKETLSFGLRVFVRDYSKVSQSKGLATASRTAEK